MQLQISTSPASGILSLFIAVLVLVSQPSWAVSTATEPEPLRCLAFSPYVSGYDPDYGPHPTPAVIDQLLDVVVNDAGFRCIMTYSSLNGLDYVFEAARKRGVKVISIIWLDDDPAVNRASIAIGITSAKAYADTIVRVSCGSEVRVRNGAAFAQTVVADCLAQARAAGVPQPLSSIDTWWGWCDEQSPCKTWGLSKTVDWIGINVFPWWENKHSGLAPCTDAAGAAAFHLERIDDIRKRYPGKEIIMTEFGWPTGPQGYRQTNQHTGKACDMASKDNQRHILESTLSALDERGLSAVVFEAFNESWKGRHEGPASDYWGICEGTAPYACSFRYGTPASARN